MAGRATVGGAGAAEPREGMPHPAKAGRGKAGASQGSCPLLIHEGRARRGDFRPQPGP